MTNKIATEQYLINLAGGGTNTPTKCATRDRVEFFGLETNNLPTDLTNVSKLLFTGYFSTYRVIVDADSVTNNAVCQSGVTTEIPINQVYIGGDTANISINVII